MTCKFQLFSAQDDIPDVDEVQTLIKDIWEIRMAKLRKCINIMVQGKEMHARVRKRCNHAHKNTQVSVPNVLTTSNSILAALRCQKSPEFDNTFFVQCSQQCQINMNLVLLTL